MKIVVLAGLLLLIPAVAAGQTNDDLKIDARWRETLLDQVGQRYDSLYFSAEKGALILRSLSAKATRARYSDCLTAKCLSDRLTEDLQKWSGDKHLRMVFSVSARPMPKAAADDAAMKASEAEAMRRRNYGFHNLERLQGNIGLIELGRFDPAADAAATAAAAFQFVANTDALIIDLRNNGGGRADMVAHLMSYFLPEQTHLGTIQRRDPANSTQIWSAAAVSAPRYLNRPVYILTSKRTFSAAEGLTYDLRNYASATVIGENTRGGANPGGFEQLDEHFAIAIPSGRMINEKTKSNWEGVGIAPDVAVPAAEAQKTAHKLALEDLLKARPADARAAMWRQAFDEMFGASSASAK
jgi:retinol-binding protein 3